MPFLLPTYLPGYILTYGVPFSILLLRPRTPLVGDHLDPGRPPLATRYPPASPHEAGDGRPPKPTRNPQRLEHSLSEPHWLGLLERVRGIPAHCHTHTPELLPDSHKKTSGAMMDAEHQAGAVPENLKARLENSYDAIADAYTAWSAKGAAIRLSYLDRLLELLPPSHRDILEVGCGAGIPTTEKLLARGPQFRITANDLSSAQIQLGKERLDQVCGGDSERVTWLRGDMMGLRLPVDSFDVVLGFYCIQHLPRDEQVVMIRKVSGWLRPGGYMLFNFPAEANENVVMTGWMGEKGWVYHSAWDADHYRHLLRTSGLHLVLDEVRGDNVKAEFLWVIAKKPDSPTTT